MWNSTFIVPIAVVFIVVGIPVLCHTILKLARILRGEPIDLDGGGNAGKGKDGSKQPGSAMQEMHQNLSRLEARIESLETLVIELHREAEKERKFKFD